LNGCIAELKVRLAIKIPSRGIADVGVNVFERNRKVDIVQVKIFDAPVCELLESNRLNVLAVMGFIP
jgi:hypothetical protein